MSETKLHFCQECQEMTFHSTDEHDSWIAEEYYERVNQEESERVTEGLKLVHLFV